MEYAPATQTIIPNKNEVRIDYGDGRFFVVARIGEWLYFTLEEHGLPTRHLRLPAQQFLTDLGIQLVPVLR